MIHKINIIVVILSFRQLFVEVVNYRKINVSVKTSNKIMFFCHVGQKCLNLIYYFYRIFCAIVLSNLKYSTVFHCPISVHECMLKAQHPMLHSTQNIVLGPGNSIRPRKSFTIYTAWDLIL